MAGCYGNNPEDRYFENKLNKYLEKFEDEQCFICGKQVEECECEVEDETT